jgi:hypothetical protein
VGLLLLSGSRSASLPPSLEYTPLAPWRWLAEMMDDG